MALGAGQVIMVGGRNLSDDVSQFRSAFLKSLADRSVIGREWRRRVDYGDRDTEWSISGFFERETVSDALDPATAGPVAVTRTYGTRVGSYGQSFAATLSPSSVLNTPVGDEGLVLWSASGTLEADSVGAELVLFPVGERALAAGNTDLYLGGGSPLDLGAAGNRTVRLRAHIIDDVAAYRIRAMHAAAQAGPWVEISAAMSVEVAGSGLVVGTEFTGQVRRYVGARVSAAAAGTLRGQVMLGME